MTTPADIWDAFNDQFLRGPDQTVTMLKLTLTGLAISTGAGTVLGLAASRMGRGGAFVVTTIGNLGRAVPTLGIMAVVAALWTLGFWPAVVGLAALGTPPVLLNTATGLRGVDRGSVEAGRGMGLTAAQLLTRVELPLAAPLILAGVRTAASEIVATAALGAFVGAGGLGILIGAGINNLQTDVLLAGAIPLAMLALAFEIALAGAQRLLTPRGLRLQRSLARQQGRLA